MQEKTSQKMKETEKKEKNANEHGKKNLPVEHIHAS